MTRVFIPIVTQSEANSREHWAKKATRAKLQRTAVWVHLYPHRGALPLPCVVRLVRVSPRDLDDDNLRMALKAVRDEVAVQVGLPVNARGQADDRDPRVTWEYSQQRGGRGERAVVVEIEPA